jgi:hypothetical protein
VLLAYRSASTTDCSKLLPAAAPLPEALLLDWTSPVPLRRCSCRRYANEADGAN